jgi:hypothetical protein
MSKDKGQKRSGTTRYKMQAVQAAQEEAARIKALDVEQKKEAPEQGAEESDGSEDNVRGLWKNRVLQSYKSKSPKDSHTLLAKIPDGKATVKVSEHYKTSNIQEEMIALVDRMFDAFQNHAYEFNQHAGGSELGLNWIRPFLSKETSATWHENQSSVSTIFSGRISTRRWTMVVKGTPEEVTVFILPADKLIGFALSHKNYRPYFTMEPYVDGLDVRWRCRNCPLPNEVFPKVYRELFMALIRHAKDEAEGTEFFDLSKIGIDASLHEQAEDPDGQREYQEAFFAEMRAKAERSTSEFGLGEGRKAPVAQPNQPQLAKPQYGQPNFQSLAVPAPQLPPQLPNQQQSTTWSGQPGQHLPPAQQPLSAQPAHLAPLPPQQGASMAPQLPPAQPAQGQMPPQPVQQTLPQAPLQPGMIPANLPHTQQHAMINMQQQTQAPTTFPAALSLLLGTLDRELAVVAKAGADAFAARDLTRADAALKFSGRLTEFRALAQELLEYYKRR